MPRSAPAFSWATPGLLSATAPDEIGGGTVDFVTPAQYDLAAEPFRRENSGTPNAVGIVAMAVAAQVLKHKIGFAAIAQHEQDLLDAARQRFPRIDGLRVLGELDYSAKRKCAILSFALEGHPHALLAARLSHEFGIGVRHGHLCQFAYVARLLGPLARRKSRPSAAKSWRAIARRCTAWSAPVSASAIEWTTFCGLATPWKKSPPRPSASNFTCKMPPASGCPRVCRRSMRPSFSAWSERRYLQPAKVCIITSVPPPHTDVATMGKKSKKHGNRQSANDIFQYAQRAMEKQDFKEALKNAKVCFRQDPSHEHRQILERSWLARGLQLARAGLQTEGRAAAQELLATGRVASRTCSRGCPNCFWR